MGSAYLVSIAGLCTGPLAVPAPRVMAPAIVPAPSMEVPKGEGEKEKHVWLVRGTERNPFRRVELRTLECACSRFTFHDVRFRGRQR
jgi:hypothetical protein